MVQNRNVNRATKTDIGQQRNVSVVVISLILDEWTLKPLLSIGVTSLGPLWIGIDFYSLYAITTGLCMDSRINTLPHTPL